MDYPLYLRRGFELIRLDSEAARTVARDEQSFGPGLLTVLIAGICVAIGRYLSAQIALKYVIFTPFGFVIFFTAGIFVIHLVALLFGGEGRLVDLHRAASVGALLGWLMIVPRIGWILMLAWYPVMLYRVLQQTHALDWRRALRAVVLSAVILLDVYLVLLGLQACGSEWAARSQPPPPPAVEAPAQ